MKTYTAGPRTAKFWELVATMRTRVDKTRIRAERNRRRYRKAVLQMRELRPD
jgi:hypothetical protein